jgi:hypothetical protein
MRKVFLAIPALSKRFCDATEMSIQLLAMECGGLGYGFEQFRWVGDSLIAHARNVCVAKFLQSDATDLFFLDSDVACGPGVFSRMLTHRVDMVAGIYRVKSEPERYAVRWAVQSGETIYSDAATGLVEANDVPFGFVRITRDAVEKMAAHYSEDWFRCRMDPSIEKCVALFNTEIVDHEFTGEDYYFCRRWKAMGGKVWVDPELPLIHTASDGEAFHGHLGNYLRGRK